jgi:hypothetical protein
MVLTTYPNAFVFEGGKPVHKPTTAKVLALVVAKGARFEPERLALGFEGHPVDVDWPVPGFHVGAGCLFAPGRFALDFPYDPALYFHGEEQSLALRLYTHGWDIFHPPGMPIYHLYNDANSVDRRPLHWDQEEDAARRVKWTELEGISRQRLAAIVGGAPLGVYGLGRERSLADFAAFSGIDYARRRVKMRAYEPRQLVGARASMRLTTTTSKLGNWSG